MGNAQRPLALSLIVASVALGASVVVADVAPPVLVRLAQDSQPALAGEPYRGVFEVELFRAGSLKDFAIVGDGWTVDEAEFPAEGYYSVPQTFHVPFVARARDPEAKIGLHVIYECQPTTRLFSVGPKYLANLGKPRPVGEQPFRPLQPGHVERDPATEGGTTRGGAIPIQVVGRLMYDRIGRDVDEDGDIADGPDILPMTLGVDTASIRLLDVDAVGDEEIWSGATDHNGYFDSGVVMWDDCDVTGCDDPDLQLEISLYKSDLQMLETDASILSLYTWHTAEMTDFTGNFHDYGEFQIVNPLEQPAFHIWNAAVRTHRYINEIAGYTPPLNYIVWPETSSGNAPGFYQSGNQTIYMRPIGEWRNDTVAHEHGHHFMYSYGSPPGTDYCNFYCDGEDPCSAGAPDCPDPGHCAGCPENAQDAWNEGWPDWLADVVGRYVQTAILYDDNTPFEPLYDRSYESLTECCQTNSVLTSGALEIEGHVAATLRDLEDSNFDYHSQTDDPEQTIRDTTCLGADEIFTLVGGTGPTTLKQFLDTFVLAYPNEIAHMRLTTTNVSPEITAAINLPPDTQPVSPVAAAQSTTHPLGEGGYLPCITLAWDPAEDDVNGACGYSWNVGLSPAVTADTMDDPVGSIGCQLAGKWITNTVGDHYLGVAARECNGDYDGTTAVFGPFEVLDCNNTGLVDLCDISCTHPGTMDCDLDFDNDINNEGDTCNLPGCGLSLDCQPNFVPDECDLASGTSRDCNENGIPDECEIHLRNWKGGSGNWNVGLNWVEAAIPVDGNDVCIEDPDAVSVVTYNSGSVTLGKIASDENLSMHCTGSPCTMTLQDPSWIHGNLSLSNVGNNSLDFQVDDRLDIDGALNLQGTNNTSAPELRGAGETHVGALNLSGGGIYLNAQDLYVEPGSTGIVSGHFVGSNGATLTIRPGAEIDFRDSSYLLSGTTSTVYVEGTLTKSTYAGTSRISSPVVNDGLIQILDGGFRYHSNSTTSGSIVGEPGTWFEFGGGVHQMLAGSTMNVPQVDFQGGSQQSVTVHGVWDVSDSTRHTGGGTLTFAPDATVLDYGSELLLSGGITEFDFVHGTTLSFTSITAANVYFNSGDPIVTQNLTIVTNGKITGPSPVTVDGHFQWSAGAFLYGPGLVTANGTTTVASGANIRYVYAPFVNSGAATFFGAITLQNGTTWDNTATGSIEHAVDGTWINGSGSIQNAGMVRKSAGGGQSTVQSQTNNSGLIEAASGTLAFYRLTQTAGETRLNGGSLLMTHNTTVLPMDMQGGTLTGTGTFGGGGVNNSGGSVEPGFSAGTITMAGDYTQGAGARMVIELGGLTPGTEHDRLMITGGATATLAGTLRVELIDGFVPAVGDTFQVVVAPDLVGVFDTIEAIGFPADRAIRIVDLTGGVTLQVYDPTCDGVVGSLAACPRSECPRIDDGGADLVLTFDDPAACPAGAPLTGAIDFVEGRMNQLAVDGGSLAAGVVAPVDCAQTLDAFLWGSPAPAASAVHFFLARPSAFADYGTSSNGEPRVVTYGDCP